MQDYNDFYPPMAVLPTTEPDPNPRPAMSVVLDEQVSGQNQVFHCPSDRIRIASMQALAEGQTTYFQWQGSSYEPRTALSFVNEFGRWRLSRENAALTEIDDQIQTLFDNASRIVLIHEYEPFHSSSGRDEAGRNALFADFHVEATASLE